MVAVDPSSVISIESWDRIKRGKAMLCIQGENSEVLPSTVTVAVMYLPDGGSYWFNVPLNEFAKK